MGPSAELAGGAGRESWPSNREAARVLDTARHAGSGLEKEKGGGLRRQGRGEGPRAYLQIGLDQL